MLSNVYSPHKSALFQNFCQLRIFIILVLGIPQTSLNSRVQTRISCRSWRLAWLVPIVITPNQLLYSLGVCLSNLTVVRNSSSSIAEVDVVAWNSTKRFVLHLICKKFTFVLFDHLCYNGCVYFVLKLLLSSSLWRRNCSWLFGFRLGPCDRCLNHWLFLYIGSELARRYHCLRLGLGF